MTNAHGALLNEPKVYFAATGGELTCSHHAGAYLRADLEARPKARKIVTPLTTWERLTSVEVALLFAEIGYCCETCHANEPTPIGTLDDSLVGRFVTVQSKRYGNKSSGTYEGIRASEWNKEPYHYFRGGYVGTTSQGTGLWGYPVSHSDDHVLIAVEEVA